MPTINVVVLGCAPQCEPRNRLPPPSDRNRERLCRTFLRMLRRMFPVPAGVEARLTVQVTQVASGVCTRHVVVRFDRTAAARAFASCVESGVPDHWDDIALWELEWFAEHDRYVALVNAGRIDEKAVPSIYRTVLPPDPPTTLPVGTSASGSDGAAMASTGRRVDVDRDREHVERQGA